MGQHVSISTLEPKGDITAAAVQQAMSQIIAKNVLTSAGGDLVAIVGARIVAQEVTEVEVV